MILSSALNENFRNGMLGTDQRLAGEWKEINWYIKGDFLQLFHGTSGPSHMGHDRDWGPFG